MYLVVFCCVSLDVVMMVMMTDCLLFIIYLFCAIFNLYMVHVLFFTISNDNREPTQDTCITLVTLLYQTITISVTISILYLMVGELFDFC